MEVHAHTHTPRKKWTHYFWEFLMLFLAVFCGFLAENQREHYIEAHRAREYAKSLFNDIKSDTADIHKGMRHVRYYVSAIDSIGMLATSLHGKTKVPGAFYYYSRLATNIYPIDWNRSTLNQLVQSGNLRYLKNKVLVDKINRYYALQSNLDGHSATDSEQRETIRSLRNKMLDNRYFSVFALLVQIDNAVDRKPLPVPVDSLLRLELPLQPGGERYLHEFLNHLNDRRPRLSNYVEKLFSHAIGSANEIMTMLQDEYNLK